MTKLFPFLLLVASLFLFSDCTSDSKAGDKQKLPKALPPLSEEKIYVESAVINYLFDNEERDTDSIHQVSRRLFLQAIDLYKNKKNSKDALPIFKKSILLFPDAKAYNELGNLLYENGEYKECLQAYQMAEAMEYSPMADSYFNMACAEASGEEAYLSNQYLEKAFQNGFRDSLRYVTDPHLNSVRSEAPYRDYLFTYLSKVDKAKQTNIKYRMFVDGFETLGLPYEIASENVGKHGSGNYIGYDFSEFIEEMENVSFGRDVSNEFCYVGVLKKTDRYTALLYSSVEMMGEEFAPVHTMLVTYNPSGEVISKRIFSCQCSAEKIKTGHYDGTILTISEQKVTWEKPFTSVSPDENSITNYETIETSKFMIDDAGNINPVTGS